MPEVSVLLPIHGTSPYLGDAIASVLAQDFGDFELLIICDRASSETLTLAQGASHADARVKVLVSEVAGLPSALNAGLRASQGPFIARIDADDLMVSNRLSSQVRHMRRDAKLVCLGSQVCYVGEKTQRSSRLPIWNWQIRLHAKTSNPIAHPSLLMRREALVGIGGYNPEFILAQDYELLSRLTRLGKVRNSPQALTHYRVHQQQMSVARAVERLPYEIAALMANNQNRGMASGGLTEILQLKKLNWKSQEDVLGYASQFRHVSSILLFSATKTIDLRKRFSFVLRAAAKNPFLVISTLFSSFLTRLMVSVNNLKG
ncbi:MAG: hypothetical protein RI929_298 [Actinomycetota bacterium]|jgi:glycosyltransferase involved in cell wall biosynthesis